MQNIANLEQIALWGRRKVVEMAARADSGHVTTACSQMELLVSLYFGGVLRYDPKDPGWDGRDVFLLSKGQGGIGLYPLLARAGFFPEGDLLNFCGRGSKIGVHAESHCPGVEMLSGSLGHGLPVATGLATAFKTDNKNNLVYCMVGDGELHEGSNWEALLTASHQKLNNLIVIVDRNGQNTIGRTRAGDDYLSTAKDGPGLDPLRDKFEAFGFKVYVCDGHSFPDVISTLDNAKGYSDFGYPHPICVIANTVKGKGLSVCEGRRDWHYRVPRGQELTRCYEDLGVPEAERFYPKIHAEAKHAVAMRDRFFDALYPHFRKDKNFVLITADNGWPGIDRFANLPGQFYQVGIAEQQAVGMAAGLALRGRKVLVYAISPFVTARVVEFVKLDACAMNLPVTMVGVGNGYSYAQMSTTHHCAEWISLMRPFPNITLYGPADGECAAAVANNIASSGGPNCVILDRGGIPDLYAKSDADKLARYGSMILRGGGDVALVSTGVMTHRALEVSEALGGVAVVDVYRLKPLDGLLLEQVRAYRGIVTLEEHQLAGGLGSVLCEHLADAGISKPVLRLGVPDRFSFELGGREPIQEACGLDLQTVVRKIQVWKETLS